MRRLFAFITLAISMIVVAIIGIPTINNSIQSGTEFAGGYDILYQVTDNEGLSYNGTALENVLDKATTNIKNPKNFLIPSIFKHLLVHPLYFYYVFYFK